MNKKRKVMYIYSSYPIKFNLTPPKPQDAEWWADDRIATEFTPPAPPSGTRGSFILPAWPWICVLATPVAAATLPPWISSFQSGL